MAKINVSELLKILIWILPLDNIFMEQQEYSVGLIWEDFKVGYFELISEGFDKPQFNFQKF